MYGTFFFSFLVYKDSIATKRTNRNISTSINFVRPFLHGLTALQAISQFFYARFRRREKGQPRFNTSQIAKRNSSCLLQI